MFEELHIRNCLFLIIFLRSAHEALYSVTGHTYYKRFVCISHTKYVIQIVLLKFRNSRQLHKQLQNFSWLPTFSTAEIIFFFFKKYIQIFFSYIYLLLFFLFTKIILNINAYSIKISSFFLYIHKNLLIEESPIFLLIYV